MPSESISQQTPTETRYDWTFTNPSGVVTSQGPLVTPVTVEHFTKSKSWVRTPNFWALRRSGAQLPDNNFTYGVLFRRNEQPFHFSGDESHPAGRLIWSLRGPANWWARSPQISRDLTAFDLYSRLAQGARNSNFSLPVTLIEAGKTVQMVAETATKLAKVIHDLRRGNLVGAAGALGISTSRSQTRRFNDRYGVNPTATAANYWLQYQYGWKPLLNDVKNGAEALAEAVSRNGDSMTKSVYASSRLVYDQVWTDFSLGVSPHVLGNIRAHVNISRKAKWRFKPNAADLPGLFGLVNPLEVAWEIVPFSFVADWFLPIGGYLSALDLPLRFQHVGGSEGYRKDVTWVTVPTRADFWGGPFQPSSSATGRGSIQEISVFRTALTGPPMPSISDMTFMANINATRATSAIALLWQQASQLRR